MSFRASNTIPHNLLQLLFLLMVFSSASAPMPLSLEQKIHLSAEASDFDYNGWMLDATWLKLQIGAIGAPRFFDETTRHKIVLQTQDLMRRLDEVDAEIEKIYANPANAADPQAASLEQRARLAELTRQYNTLAPLAEATLETEVGEIAAALGLTLGGQPSPPVLYHVSPLPQNLVISRREVIEQQSNLLLDPNLSTEQAQQLESRIDSQFGVSSLVVPIGGVALYPTMVYRSSDLSWLAATIAHEWIHTYMASDPIAEQYSDPQVRTMNETTAEIAGREIGDLLMRNYYPELLRRQDATRQLAAALPAENFDFNAEMRQTRVTADALLAAGKIEQAEAYMETRRKFFWDNGYPIRKINQAYFAFYGAYADTPGGAAGEDPVGPAVRQLRARSASLKEFVNTIRKMGSFTELQAALEKQP